ncbi:MAG: Trk system potassium transporter TrkA [Candidatus Zixiibacteriota bacterium]
MNVVIIGMGEVGKHITEVLLSEGQNVTLIDQSESALAHAHETMDVMTLRGDGGSIATLSQAGIDHSDLVVAVTDNDEINLLACLLAKRLGAKKVVARVSDTDDPLASESEWAQNLGIDLVISPERAAAVEIRRVVDSAGLSWVESFGEDRIEMIQVRIDREQSESIGQALKDIELPGNALVAAIARGETFIIPDGNEHIADGDDVYLIGKSDALPEARRILAGPYRQTSKVVIMGASPTGRALAQLLEKSGIDTIVIERDAERAQQLAMELESGVVLRGDGTQSDFLREENLDNADIFIATTKSDELNLMAGLLAKKLGIAIAIAIAHKPDYAPIYRELGIDHTISPRLLAAKEILRYIRRGPTVSVSVLAGGAGQILELEAEEGAIITTKRLADVGFPQGARIGAVTTDAGVHVPGGNFTVPEGARVIVFSTPDNRKAVEKMFHANRKSIFSMKK